MGARVATTSMASPKKKSRTKRKSVVRSKTKPHRRIGRFGFEIDIKSLPGGKRLGIRSPVKTKRSRRR